MMPARRHDRRVPDRVARAAVDAAAAEARVLLRPRDRGRDRAARARSRAAWCIRTCAAAGTGARHLSERRGQERARAHARRADLPGAGDAARDRRGGLHAGRGRPAAPLDGGVAAQGRPREVRAAPDRRHGAARLCRRRSRARSTSRSWASASTAFRNRIRRRSRCSSTSRRGSSATSRRRSPRALLNSQPMGFYAPAQLVADARRHGVEVRPRGRRRSATGTARWRADAGDGAIPALRLGLRMIAGLTEDGAQAHRRRARAARRSRTSPISRTARSSTAATSTALADADALAALAGHRHDAVWDVAGVEKLPPHCSQARRSTEADPAAARRRPKARTSSPTTARSASRCGRHPLALLRRKLRQRRLVTAAEIARTPHGRIVRTAGIVIGRQRPDTASGVIFVTLEDETGATNVIVWRDLSDRQRRELLGSRLHGGVRHGRARRRGRARARRPARRPHAHAGIAADALAGLPLAEPGNFA